MPFKDQLFSFLSLLTLVAIGCFAYFSMQVNWPPMAALGGGDPTQVTPPPPVAELTPQQKVGEKLFKTNCAACHKLDKVLTGPALSGIGEKYAAEKEWLFSWIRDSQRMVKAGDAKAVKLFQEWNNTMMLGFPTLSDEDIEAIIAYTG